MRQTHPQAHLAVIALATAAAGALRRRASRADAGAGRRRSPWRSASPPTRAAPRRRRCACAPSWRAPGTIRSPPGSRLIGARAVEIAAVDAALRAAAGARRTATASTPATGPAYCSGNQTVFVGTDAAYRLMAKFGPQGEAGITFLIGHEIGHHIQNIHGRFHYLAQALTADAVAAASSWCAASSWRPTAMPACGYRPATRGARRAPSAPICRACWPTSATTPLSVARPTRTRSRRRARHVGAAHALVHARDAERQPRRLRYLRRGAALRWRQFPQLQRQDAIEASIAARLEMDLSFSAPTRYSALPR